VTDPLIALADRQHGLVARWQCRAEGMSAEAVRGRLGRNWADVSDEVLRRTGSHPGRAQTALAGVLDCGPGAALADTSAAAWWRVAGPQLRPIRVVRVSRTHRRSSLATISTVRRLPERWTTVLDGIRIARPELVALQLFSSQPYERAERWVERMWSMRLLSGRSIDRFLDDHGRRGRNGTAALRRYLEPRGVGYVPPASNTESRTQQVLSDAGITVDRQVDTGDDEHWTGRVDFRVRGTSVLLEVQSEFHHAALVDRDADARRLAALAAAGFDVVEATDTEVYHQPWVVVRRVRDAVRRARRRST
jgi:very-short-patch-repair endonuclease